MNSSICNNNEKSKKGFEIECNPKFWRVLQQLQHDVILILLTMFGFMWIILLGAGGIQNMKYMSRMYENMVEKEHEINISICVIHS